MVEGGRGGGRVWRVGREKRCEERRGEREERERGGGGLKGGK
jgi:hypothetical protein